jgi:uncharacterized protein YecE (DUF72 family)
VEINSSFYRSHRTSTYERWAASTPDNFRVSVKLPKQITHVARLADSDDAIEQFSVEVAGLQSKLGVVLVQLPPSLPFDVKIADTFFQALRRHLPCPVVCEPRHLTWFDEKAQIVFQSHDVGRVAADPSIVPSAALPGGNRACTYFRQHGSPQVYYSAYDEADLARIAQQLLAAAQISTSVWCIFDNTAAGAAIPNALALMKLVGESGRELG